MVPTAQGRSALGPLLVRTRAAWCPGLGSIKRVKDTGGGEYLEILLLVEW